MFQKGLLAVFVYCFTVYSFTQTPHQTPDHPKGNSATMLIALPLYNEACELYKNKEISLCKKSLYEAFSISYDLTEVQLFLGDIYYQENNLDSAFFFYHSGIDFNIEQKPHYYFRLFELGFKLGLYDYVKKNIGHFNKLYSNHPLDLPYESEFHFTKKDLEFYESSIKLVTDYKNWILSSQFINSAVINDHCLPFIDTDKKNKLTNAKDKIKRLPSTVNDLFISQDKTIIIYSISERDSVFLYAGTLKRNKIKNAKILPKEINNSNWQGTPFLCSDNKTFYYSSSIHNNKDIFVTTIDFASNSISQTFSLDRINTDKDEISPYYNEQKKQFYFSSNGYVGFGGFDVFFCDHSEVKNQNILPFDPQNFGATFNSHQDEISFSNHLETDFLIRKSSQNTSLLHFKRLAKNYFVYNL